MKKLVLIALGAVVIGGCSSAPVKPEAAKQAESASVAESAVVAAVAPAAVATPVTEPAVVAPVVAPVVVAEAESPVAAAVPAAAAEPFVRQAETAVPVVSAQAQALDPRMNQIVKLINTSSGAKQVIGSDNPKAHQHHARARALYDQALHASGKAEAARFLNQAVMAMYTAIRSAAPDTVLAEKRQADFDRLKRSIDTFMEQQQRISEEKGSVSEGQVLRAQVNTLVAKAEQAYAAKQHDNAQHLLRESFEMLRDSIESMREGETLVRSLNFANKKEEYDYELERLNSQLVLVEILLKDKREASAYVAKQVDQYVSVAEASRTKAESSAAAGDHESALGFLEQARKQVVRALRTGGIYVPG